MHGSISPLVADTKCIKVEPAHLDAATRAREVPAVGEVSFASSGLFFGPARRRRAARRFARAFNNRAFLLRFTAQLHKLSR